MWIWYSHWLHEVSLGCGGCLCVCKSVYVSLQTIRIPTSKNFARIQNINVYKVLWEGIMRIYLKCPRVYQGSSEEPVPPVSEVSREEIKRLKASGLSACTLLKHQRNWEVCGGISNLNSGSFHFPFSCTPITLQAMCKVQKLSKQTRVFFKRVVP